MDNFDSVEKDIQMFKRIMRDMIKEIDETAGDTYTFNDSKGKIVLSKEKAKSQVRKVVKEAAVDFIINKAREQRAYNSERITK